MCAVRLSIRGHAIHDSVRGAFSPSPVPSPVSNVQRVPAACRTVMLLRRRCRVGVVWYACCPWASRPSWAGVRVGARESCHPRPPTRAQGPSGKRLPRRRWRGGTAGRRPRPRFGREPRGETEEAARRGGARARATRPRHGPSRQRRGKPCVPAWLILLSINFKITPPAPRARRTAVARPQDRARGPTLWPSAHAETLEHGVSVVTRMNR